MYTKRRNVKGSGASLSAKECTELLNKEIIRQRRIEEEAAMGKATYLLSSIGLNAPHPDEFSTTMEFLEADRLYRDKLAYYYDAILKGTMRVT